MPYVGIALLVSGLWVRTAAAETGGKPIWWIDVRPLHLVLWLLSKISLVVLHAPRLFGVLLGCNVLVGVLACSLLKPSDKKST